MIFKELDVEEQKKKQLDVQGEQLLEGGQLSMDPITQQEQQELNSEKTAVKAKVMDNIPASMTFDDMRRELAFAQYKVGKEEGTRTKHSKSMTKVLNELEAMDFVYDTPVDLESFESQMKFMEDRYHHLIESCREYEKSHRPWTGEGQARKERVRKIREKATEELGRLKENAESFRNTMSPDAPATWRDVIRDSRRIKYKNNVDGVKVSRTGGNTSTVHVIEKDGQKLFFKERETLEKVDYRKSHDDYIAKMEKIADGSSEILQGLSKDEIEKMKTDAALKIEIAKDMQAFIKKHSDIVPEPFLKNIVRGNLNNVIKTYARQMPDFAKTKFYNEIKKVMPQIERDAARCEETKALIEEMEKKKDMTPEEKEEYGKLLREHRELDIGRPAYLDTTVGVLRQIYNPMFGSGLAERAPQIKYGRDLSCRNVAATRLAEFLGIGDCVVKSQNAKLEINGKEMDGIVMEEAKGVELMDLTMEAKSRKGTYSMKACKKLLSLQVFDVITGQTDRHQKNILGQITKNGRDFIIDDITGIDSDLSFGNLCWERLLWKANDIGAMRCLADTMGRFTLPAMSKELADQILALDYRTLQYLLGDLLEPDEITALNDRLTGVQGQIELKMKAEEDAKKRAEKNGTKPPKSVFLETDEEWAEFMERAKKNPKLVDLTYMKKECL